MLQLNMCGSARHKGDAGMLVEAIAELVLGHRPGVVLLNEACLGQIDRLWWELEHAGAAMSGAFGATSAKSNCKGRPGRRWYGNAVLCAGPGIGEPQVSALPNRSGASEERAAIGMQANLDGRHVWAHALHLVPRNREEEINRRQITELAKIFNARAASGEAVILGGDFNAPPDRLQELSTHGRFQDIDYSGNRPTYRNEKIDYIFLSRERFSDLSGRPIRSSVSDHAPLLGGATLRVPALQPEAPP